MQINIPDVPAIYETLKLANNETARDTVESAEWVEKALPELDSLIRDYNAARKSLDSELSRAEQAREYINGFDARIRLQRIKSCQK